MPDEAGVQTLSPIETQRLKNPSSGSDLEKVRPDKSSSGAPDILTENSKKRLDQVTDGVDADKLLRDLADGSLLGGVKAFGKPKSPETVKAQAAAFAAEGVEYYKDKRHILDNLDSLVQDGASDVTRVTESPEFHKDESGKVVKAPEGTERTVAKRADYVSFLRSVGGSRYEGVQIRSEMLKAYNEFAPEIERLKIELADPAKRKEHPAFLGSGSNSMVFSISKDNKLYAVRVPSGPNTSPNLIDSHMAGAVLGKGVPHLEQIVAASYEDGVTVAEMMPGKEVGSLTLEDIGQITDQQLGDLVDTLIAVRERGIEIDPKPSNFLYDPESGFGIVDYHSSRVAGETSADQELGQIVGWMTTSIDNAGLYGIKYDKQEKSIEDYAHGLDFHKANLGVLRRYRAVVDNKLKGEDRRIALERIDKNIEADQARVEDYSNPQWVAEEIAKDAEYSRKLKERTKQPQLGWGDIVS